MAELFGRTWRREDLLRRVGTVDALAGVRSAVADDGRERGSRSLHLHTGGGLEAVILSERALDLGPVRYRGVPLHWASPAGWAHPAYFEPEGSGWLRGFGGGLMVTGGLRQFGAPNRDEGEDLGLHGRVSHLPAERVAWHGAWHGDEYELTVHGRVRQARLFGENLLLERTWRTRLGATWLELEDVVTNEGFEPQPHLILYHGQCGFPLLNDDATLHLDAVRTEPRDADAAERLERWPDLGAPQAGFRERVFRHEVRPDGDGWGRARVASPTAGLTLELAFDTAPLPHLYQWTMTGEGAYVLGLEPANAPAMLGRHAAREAGTLPWLQPGESRRYRLRWSVHEGP